MLNINYPLIQSLESELQELLHTKSALLKNKKTAPKGTLHIFQKRHKPQYYNYLDKKRNYIPIQKQKLAQKLAQKDYEEQLLELIESRIIQIQQLLDIYKTSYINHYETFSEFRKSLITPVVMDDDEFVKQWYENNPGMQNTYPNEKPSYTNKDEPVRSKSEKIIADLFEYKGIPYIYEPKIVLSNNTFIIPDYLVLNVRLRKTFVYEHFGMFDDNNYTNKNIEKLNNYAMHGYFPGDNLLFSLETLDTPLNTHYVEKLIDHYLL